MWLINVYHLFKVGSKVEFLIVLFLSLRHNKNMASENQLTPMNKNKLNDLSYTNDIQYFKSINIMIHFYDV